MPKPQKQELVVKHTFLFPSMENPPEITVNGSQISIVDQGITEIPQELASEYGATITNLVLSDNQIK